MKEEVRKSNFELLRIVSMCMIIGLHFFQNQYGGVFDALEDGSINQTITWYLYGAFVNGVNAFIMITGYFSIHSRKLKLNKCTELFLLIAYYGALCYVISCIVGLQVFSVKKLIKSTIPFAFNLRWFAKYYMILLLFVPFMNIAFAKLTKKSFTLLVAVCLFIFSIWYSCLPGAPINDGGYGLGNFILFYVIGAYIRKYDDKQRNIYILAILYALICFCNLFLREGYFSQVVWGYSFIGNVANSVILFEIFKNMHIGYSKVINWFSKSAFAVYLLHSDPYLAKSIYRCFGSTRFVHSWMYVPMLTFALVGIYLVCTVFDKVFGAVYLKLYHWTFGRLALDQTIKEEG